MNRAFVQQVAVAVVAGLIVAWFSNRRDDRAEFWR